MIAKFRAWDKENDQMLFPDDTDKIYFEITTDGIVTYDMDHILPDGTFTGLDTVVMQSSGLKDKNDNDIFEGDIVKCTVDNWSNGEKFEQVDKVVYEDCMFTFSDGFKYDCSITHPAYLNKEVIGNIYENPELII